LFSAASTASADTYTWNYNTSGTTVVDGDGTWDTTATHWWSTGETEQAWGDTGETDTAVFGTGSPASNPYTVTVASGGVSAGGIVFQNQAYTLTGDTITLGGSTPTITVNASSGTIVSVLAGTAGMIKNGNGLLALSSPTNTYSGATTISGGTLQLCGTIQPILNAILGTSLVHLDASNTATLTTSGGMVTAWNDTSGNANNLTNPASVAMVATVDGRQWVSFPGNGTSANTLTNSTWTSNNAFGNEQATMFVVYGLNGLQWNYNVIATGACATWTTGGGEWWCHSYSGTNGPAYLTPFAGTAAHRVRVTTPCVGSAVATISVSGDYAATNVSIITSGGTTTGTGGGQGSETFGPSTTLTIGGGGYDVHSTNPVSPETNLNGYVGEVLIFNSVLSAAQQQLVDQYLSYKWLGVGNSPLGSNVLPTTTPLQIGSGATVDLCGVNEQIASLSGSGTLTNSFASPTTLTIGGTGRTSFAGTISDIGVGGPLELMIGGSGGLTLTGANTYSGATTISSGGTLQIGAGGNTGSLPGGTAISNSGVLAFNLISNVTQSATSGTNAISGPGSLVQRGPGTLTLDVANSYSGSTTVSTGTLAIANAAAAQSSTLTMNGGTLVFDSSAGNAFTLGGLSAAAAGPGYDIALQNTAGAAIALTVGGNGAATTYAGVLSGAGGLTMAGSGMLTLSGNNTYTGGTNVLAGTIDFSRTSSMPSSGAILVYPGATLAVGFGGAGQFSGATSGAG
jgi:autotransporter-associated beta strand protein